MAYTIPNYASFTPGFNFQEFVPGTDEYERKRREQELLAQQSQPTSAGPVNPSLMDRFSNNIQRGLDNLQQAPQNFVNNVQQLPDQVQQGLQNVQNMVSPVSPDQQVQVAGPTVMPPAQTVQQPQPQNQYSLATGQSGLGLQMPQQPAPTASQQMVEKYHSIQDNPKELMNMGYDETMPEWMRERARSRSVDLLTQSRQEQKAKEQLATMSDTDLGKALLKKTSDGNWLKYLALKHVGLNDLADAEGAKLGIGKETYATLNNEPVSLKMSNNGTPIEGFNAVTGKKLSPNELVAAAQNAILQKGTQTHTGKMQDITTNEVYYERTTPNGIELVDNNGKRYTGPSSNLRPFGIGSDIRTRNEIQLQELNNKLAYAPANKRAEVLAEHEAKYGRLSDDVRSQILSAQPTAQVSGATPIARPPAPAAAPAAAPATTAPASPPVTASALPGGGVKVTPNKTSTGTTPAKGATPAQIQTQQVLTQKAGEADIEVGAAGRKTRAETAAKTIDEKLDSLNIIQDTAQRGLDAIENNQHLFGGGTNAIARANNRLNPLKTQSDEYRNTADIMQLAQRENLSKLASMLKGSFSDKDLAYINKNMINENSSPAQVKRWLEAYVRASRRAYEQQATSVNQPNAPSPNAPPMPPSQTNKTRKYNPATGQLE